MMADVARSGDAEMPSDVDDRHVEDVDGAGSDATSAGASGTSDHEREGSPSATGRMSTDGNATASTEEVPLDPDHIEERLRVDRRKLEQMLQAGGNDDGQTGESFFAGVMDKTQTHITWPSKLKIGAKSKKDPHVKIRGLPENVQHARQLVMATLDTKSNRVTLKMDVAHTEHSHVIGKGGQNIKRVMADTSCHIHFPDCNTAERRPQTEKSNQVSIAGQPQGVESARQQIRQLLPLTLIFDLPLMAPAALSPDAASPAVQALAQRYGVQISFRSRPHMLLSTCIVRGVQVHAAAVMEATRALVEHLVGSPQGVTVNMTLDIAPQHHLFMIGRNGLNVKQIMHRTGASIEFPDSNAPFTQRRSAVTVRGTIESVCNARQLLLGCLPLVLMFDIKDDQNAITEPPLLTQIMEGLDVFISIKPKPKQPSRSVIVKSVERNAANMYQARLCLLGQEPLPVAQRGSSLLPPGAVRSGRRGSLDSAFAVMPGTWSHSPTTYASAFSIPSLIENSDRGAGLSHALSSNQTRLDRPDDESSGGLGPSPAIHGLSVRTRSSPGTWERGNPLSPTGSASTELTSPMGQGRDAGVGRSPSASSPMGQPARLLGMDGMRQHSADHGNSHTGILGRDYDFKRQKALQAVERGRASAPGIRTPTDTWSGCGFSKSMPSSALRDHLPLRRVGMAPGRDFGGRSVWPLRKAPSAFPSSTRNSHVDSIFESPSPSPGGTNGSRSNYQDVEDLADLLMRIGLSQYAQMFEEQEVDLTTFLTLNESDFKDLGITTLGARRRMSIAIDEMQRHDSSGQLNRRGRPGSGGSAASAHSVELSSSAGSASNIFHELRNPPAIRSASNPFHPKDFSRSGQW